MEPPEFAIVAARVSVHHVVVRHEAPRDEKGRGERVVGSCKVEDQYQR